MSRRTGPNPARPSLKITVSNRQRGRPVDGRWLRRLAEYVVRDLLGLDRAEVGLHLVRATEIARLNHQFLGHLGPTDVISFDYSRAWPGPVGLTHPPPRKPVGRSKTPPVPRQAALWGDLVICVEEAVAQARRFRTRWTTELARYLIHGLLHLRGYTDATPAARRRMKAQEDRLLRQAARQIPLSRLARTKRLGADR